MNALKHLICFFHLGARGPSALNNPSWTFNQKLQAALDERSTALKKQEDGIKVLTQRVEQQKSIEDEMAKFRAQLSTMRSERDKAVKEAAQLAVARAAFETQKAETDSVKAALHDCYEEIENLYDEVEQLCKSKDAHVITGGTSSSDATEDSLTSRSRFLQRHQEFANALHVMKDAEKNVSGYREELGAIHRELVDAKSSLVRAAEQAAADDRELHKLRRTKVELEKALGTARSDASEKRPIENQEMTRQLAAANKELTDLRAMNSALGTDRADLMIRLDASEQDLKRTRSKLDAMKNSFPSAGPVSHSPSSIATGECLKRELEETKDKLEQEMYRSSTLQSEVVFSVSARPFSCVGSPLLFCSLSSSISTGNVC